MTNNDLILTVAEAAEILKISKADCYKLIHNKELSAIRVGSIKVPRMCLDDFINKKIKEGVNCERLDKTT